MDELHCFLKANEADVLILTETWLTSREADMFLKIYSIYRLPKYDVKEFMKVLHELLISQRDTAIIVGDINVDILDKNSDITSSYINMII